jgi:hypothetical protein
MNVSGSQAAGIREAALLMHLVADQIAQLTWQSPREFGRNIEDLPPRQRRAGSERRWPLLFFKASTSFRRNAPPIRGNCAQVVNRRLSASRPPRSRRHTWKICLHGEARVPHSSAVPDKDGNCVRCLHPKSQHELEDDV